MINRRTVMKGMLGLSTWAMALAVAGAWVRPAAAASLEGAKAAGYIGERPDGYLGVVTSDAPADVRQMVEEINGQRRQKYAEIAGRTGTSVRDVGIVAGQKLIGGTDPGHFYMNAQGAWVRR